MNRAVSSEMLTAQPEQHRNFLSEPARWPAQVGLLALSVLLLSLSLAPFKLFPLAWIGLAPWMVVVARAGSARAAFAWGFLGAWIFFLANMWWVWFVSPPGLFALTLYIALFWGFAAMMVRGVARKPVTNGLRASISILLIAAIWTSLEWLRGNVSFLGKQGLPWLYLGQTQSPLLVMCQVADFASVLGVSFWMALVNGLLVLVFLHWRRKTVLAAPVALVFTILLAVAAYGIFRLNQNTTYAGPSVLVVQSNYPQRNTGEKGASDEEIVEFHVSTTERALRETNHDVDLVVWSETMMPEINHRARRLLRGQKTQRHEDLGEYLDQTVERLERLAREHGVALLVGLRYFDAQLGSDPDDIVYDRRNSAVMISDAGQLDPQRYDKIHLVPFGEYIPFKDSIPPLYELFIRLGPNYSEEYALTRGSELTVFTLEDADEARSYRFVVPICFEDIVPSLVARMVNGGDGTKRADFLINITNDGWFRDNQMSQHLQAAVFRSIENRLPTARSVNTGVSGFIDPLGRVHDTVPAAREGTSISALVLDRRVAPYTRIGDVFPLACLVTTGIAMAWMIAASRSARSRG